MHMAGEERTHSSPKAHALPCRSSSSRILAFVAFTSTLLSPSLPPARSSRDCAVRRSAVRYAWRAVGVEWGPGSPADKGADEAWAKAVDHEPEVVCVGGS